jgi:hypothetical protein
LLVVRCSAITPITPAKLSHVKPQTKIYGLPGGINSWPDGGMRTGNSLEKDFSPTSQDQVALQQIKERGALPLIDSGQIRQAIGSLQQYLGVITRRRLWPV